MRKKEERTIQENDLLPNEKREGEYDWFRPMDCQTMNLNEKSIKRKTISLNRYSL